MCCQLTSSSSTMPPAFRDLIQPFCVFDHNSVDNGHFRQASILDSPISVGGMES